MSEEIGHIEFVLAHIMRLAHVTHKKKKKKKNC